MTTPEHANKPISEDAQFAALAAFCHRLGSPLGAIVNHLFLLDMDREALPGPGQEALDGVQSAVTDTRTLLDTVRLWLDAQRRSLNIDTLSCAQACEALQAECDAAGSVRVDPEALAVLSQSMAAHGRLERAVIADGALQVTWTSDAQFAGTTEPHSLLDPFGSAATLPRWACADVLARRLGSEIELQSHTDSHIAATLRLPLTLTLDEGSPS